MFGLALAPRPPIGNHSRMAILSDKWIRTQALEHGMIEPFVEAQRRDGVISYGLSSYGYDARVAPERLFDALVQYRDTRSHEGRRRQLQYVGKLMREVDDAPLREAVAESKLGSARETLLLHQAGDGSVDVHDGTAGEIKQPHVAQPAAAPYPVNNWRIAQQHPRC